MLELNQKVSYGTTGVCVVERIEEKKIGRELKRYYVLKPVSQATSTVFLPADNEKLLLKVRKVLTADEVKDIISASKSEPDIWPENDAERKIAFNGIITSGDRKACLVMMRSLQNRQNVLSSNGKRLHIADERALKEAQRLVHDEFSVALDIKSDEIGSYLKTHMCIK